MILFEFEDKEHTTVEEYFKYLYLWGVQDNEVLLRQVKRLYDRDPDYLMPLLLMADLEREMGLEDRASAHNEEAYKRVGVIVCVNGTWPDRILWGWMENRHLLGALEDYGDALWRHGQSDEALAIYKQMMSLNPPDNQGVRFKILALRMEYTFAQHHELHETTQAGLMEWAEMFAKFAKEFPEDFGPRPDEQ